MGLFANMGMYGLDKEEPYFLAAMLTGDPVLMIGTHGSGKTYFSHTVAATLQAEYVCYDASKAMFEDILGFPNPKALVQGMVDYIPTPMSILPKEFVLVDEISRAHVQMQNKWLEIIRSRQIMGIKCRRLKWVWAAMNPLSYEGAVPLDEALAGRFSFIIIMPEIHMMDQVDSINIITNVNGDDMTAFGHWGDQKKSHPPLPSDELIAMMHEGNRHFRDVMRDMEAPAAMYVDRLIRVLYEKSEGKIILDGRRAGMICRNILSVLAIQRALKEPQDMDLTVLNILLRSMPHVATGRELDPAILMSAHQLVAPALRLKRDVNYTIMIERDFTTKLALTLSNPRDVHPGTLKEIVATIVRRDEHLPLVLALTPIALKFPGYFDVDSIIQLCARVGELDGASEINFKLDKASVLSLDDLSQVMAAMSSSATGLMAMRAAAHVLNSKAKVDNKGNKVYEEVSLGQFNDLSRKYKAQIDRVVEALKPSYAKMVAGTYGEEEQEDGNRPGSQEHTEAT